MTGEVYETDTQFIPETKADTISGIWNSWNNQRQEWISEKKELRKYLFATDTTKTSNSTLPWKNSTTLPKITQIRDNLHSNYIAAAFPNDNWLKWEGYSLEAEVAAKKDAITAYMANKTREDNFRETISQLLLDYIDYGNAFVDVKFVQEFKEDPATGEQIPQYIGPRAVRIHPFNIVFNPLAESFNKSSKVVRTLKNMGELKKDAEDQPQNAGLQKAVKVAEEMRAEASRASTSSKEDTDMWEGLNVDGFGNYSEYLRSGMVELLEFEGDIFDPESGKLMRNRRIVIADRMTVLLDEPLPEWLGSTKYHVGWRSRPDNGWAMGPLDNLVGMQYRIDHLENLKADVFDLIAYPPFLVRGEVEEFTWAPNEEIHVNENGSVEFLAPPAQALNADNQIALLEARMEEFAGAPKQAMGIRTPGEKTAFEVQQLQNAAGRIFQVKINNFEINLLEPLLNAMLEVARRNLDMVDTIRVMDTDVGVVSFMNVTKEDITAAGKLRPIGSRHFAAQAQLMQNLLQLFNSSVGQLILPNLNSTELTKLVEEALQLERFQLFQENAQLFEQANRERLAIQIQEQLAVEQQTPTSI
jgi:hypothetical protein